MTAKILVRRGQYLDPGDGFPQLIGTDRDALVLGAYKPDASTTGVLPGVARTTVTAASQLPGGGLIPGSTYTNLNVQFTVVPPISTTKIVFKNCLFQGPPTAPTGPDGLLRLYNGGHAPIEAWDCTLLPQVKSSFWNGFHGDDFKAYRCDISRVGDAFSVFSRPTPGTALGVEIYQSYVHDYIWFPWPQPGTTNPDGSHNDGVQLQSGLGFKFWGNNVQGFNDPDYFNTYYGTIHATSCLMLQNNDGTTGAMDIQYTWFDGGAASINITTGPITGAGILKNNKFGRNQRNGDTWAINRPSGIDMDFGTGATQNVYEDNGAVVPLRNA